MVAVIQLSIALGSLVGGVPFDSVGYQSTRGRVGGAGGRSLSRFSGVALATAAAA